MSLRDAVRAEATERTWSQGVTLAREGRVEKRATNGDETEYEVRVPGRPTPFEVVLGRDEWQCNCPSKEAACSHVVAAVLAEDQGATVQNGATLRYILEPDVGGVRVERMLVRGDRSEPLGGSLMSMVGAGKASGIATLEADLLADQVLGGRSVAVSGEKLARLLEVLVDARDVRWRGQPVKTRGDPVMPRAIVEDAPGGVRVRIEKDPTIVEVAAVGMVHTRDNVLHPIGAIDLTGARLEKLPQTFDVPRSAIPELLGKTIPALQQRIEVSVRATALPKLGAREEPRLQLVVLCDGDKLVVLPTLVYGDPARARVDGGRLVHIDGPLPLRDEDAERRLVHRLRDELNLVPGRRVELVGREAMLMQQNLGNWIRVDAKSAGGKTVTLDVQLTINGGKLDVSVEGGGRAASVGAALRAWQNGVDVVPLQGGGWGRAPC